MTSRRDFLAGASASMAGAALMGPDPAQAQRMLSLGQLGPGNFHQDMLKVAARTNAIAIPSYRFGVVMRSGIAATGSSGSVTVEATADLVGVNLDLLQSIAHQAFADFATKVQATGRQILTFADFSTAKGYDKIKSTAQPFLKKPFADARTVALVAPKGLPLVNLHINAPLSDQGPASLGNWRALNGMSADRKCLVIIPTVVLDFAALTGSGHKVYGGAASVGITPGLYLVPQFTQITMVHAKIALAGDMGRMLLRDRVAVGQAGRLVRTSNYNNRAEIEEWNAYVNSMRWWNEPNLAGPLRPTQAYDYSTYQYRVDPARFAEACLDAAKAVNASYVWALSGNPVK